MIQHSPAHRSNDLDQSLLVISLICAFDVVIITRHMPCNGRYDVLLKLSILGSVLSYVVNEGGLEEMAVDALQSINLINSLVLQLRHEELVCNNPQFGETSSLLSSEADQVLARTILFGYICEFSIEMRGKRLLV